MVINLDKEIKQVKIVLDKIGFHEKVQVVLALDISYSMNSMFRQGVVQELVERLLAIGINMDINKEIDVYLFGERAHHAAQAYIGNIDGFVTTEITNRFSLEQTTRYQPVMKLIAEDFNFNLSTTRTFFNKIIGKGANSTGDPVVVFFVTDGENFDKQETELFIKGISDFPIFWQFVGIGGTKFTFLERLDELQNRRVDNANFFDAGDIAKISNDVLYSRILNELPVWYKEAKREGVIR